MTQEEGMLHYEAGHYELHGYPLRPGGVIEVFTGSRWAPGYIAYEREWKDHSSSIHARMVN